jgi:hypothetical protein
MDNQEELEQKIKELEGRILQLDLDKTALELINIKLGYSTKIMSEFHLTQDDKQNIANSIDLTTNAAEVKLVYDQYHKMLYNKSLGEGMEEFQMSEDFKGNIFSYLTVSLGENPIDKMRGDIIILKEYFDYENKIRSTPNPDHRLAMTDKLLEKRVGTTEALNRVIDSVNFFGKDKE